MPRTAVTVSSIPAYLAGGNPTAVAGDAANDHTVDLSGSYNGRLVLLAVNSNAATVDFTLELPASAATYNATVSISHTIPAAAGGVDGVRVIPLNSPAAAQSGNVLHIDSADANFGDVRFYAFTWAQTPR
jgi:hypothetical protein